MARTDAFDGFSEFLAIVRCGSFRGAAIELGVTPGAVSQAVQALERRLGPPLFHRTTRKVALTEAGELLLARLGPAAEAISGTLDTLSQLRSEPSGTLRLLVHRMALTHVVTPVLAGFCRAWPKLRVEVTVDDANTEMVAGGYDAGIRIGEFIDRDMVAVRVSPPFSWVVVGSPDYLDRRGRPLMPEEIAGHDCIRYRRPDIGDVYRWEFERDGQALSIEPPGGITVNDAGLLLSLAIDGMGLTYMSSLQADTALAEGRLETVLRDFAPARDSLFIYFARSSRNQPKLRAFVDACARLAR